MILKFVFASFDLFLFLRFCVFLNCPFLYITHIVLHNYRKLAVIGYVITFVTFDHV